MRPPIVSLGLYGGSRTQGMGENSMYFREGMTRLGKKRNLMKVYSRFEAYKDECKVDNQG
jgi:hypothetical protein